MEPKQKQRPPSTADPPTRSSSSSSSSESESESESDEQQQQQPDPNRIVQDFTSSSSEEDDQQQQQPSRNPNSKPSESESDSDSEPKLATPAQKHKQPAPEPPKSGSKRPAENDAGPKPASKKPTPPPDNSDEAEDDGKKPEEGGGGGGGHLKFFHRVFSDEDELAILKGMVEFISRTGQDPIKYPDSFHSSMKKSLQLEASVNQLKEKIRRLRRKFETNLLRAKDGEDPKFFKSHDHTVFELSKKVWGEASMMVVKPILNGKPPKSPNPKKKGGGGTGNVAIKTCLADVDSLYREISGVKELNEDEMKRGLALIGESKRKELEGRWKKLRLVEIELVANRSLLTGEQIKLIHEALESSGK